MYPRVCPPGCFQTPQRALESLFGISYLDPCCLGLRVVVSSLLPLPSLHEAPGSPHLFLNFCSPFHLATSTVPPSPVFRNDIIRGV